MTENILPIKNMVCNRCVMVVTDVLKRIEIPFEQVILGEVHLKRPLSTDERSLTILELEKLGFNVIDSKTSNLIEKIKSLVIQRARNEGPEESSRLKLSTFLSSTLHHEYTYLSSLFSSAENRTIENYFIEQRIEYAKELLVYGELTLSEIAFKLEYSSTAHLSNQFKKITGLTPSHYKQIGVLKRKALDHV